VFRISKIFYLENKKSFCVVIQSKNRTENIQKLFKFSNCYFYQNLSGLSRVFFKISQKTYICLTPDSLPRRKGRKTDGRDLFYPHTFAESHGCKPSHQYIGVQGKAVDECSYSLAQARNRQSHTCKPPHQYIGVRGKGVEVYWPAAVGGYYFVYFTGFAERRHPARTISAKTIYET